MNNFADILKKETLAIHQQVEKTVIQRIKNVNNLDAYKMLLLDFYRFYKSIEDASLPYLEEGNYPHKPNYQRSLKIKDDLMSLGSEAPAISPKNHPDISSLKEALSAIYVLEGSALGGPYIAKMLEKRGIDQSLSFFMGDGEKGMENWQDFRRHLNELPIQENEKQELIQLVKEVFLSFENQLKTS